MRASSHVHHHCSPSSLIYFCPKVFLSFYGLLLNDPQHLGECVVGATPTNTVETPRQGYDGAVLYHYGVFFFVRPTEQWQKLEG